MKADEKACPKCAEPIKKAALVCKHCGYAFSPEELAAQKAADAQANKATGIGCLAVVGLLLLLGMCTASLDGSDSSSSGSSAEDAAVAAEERRKGFHCLSSWDGAHRGIIDALKESLRDPKSFEHIETRITPVNEQGNHVLMMEYRARNGFGGMNIGKLVATVSNADCSFTIVANDSD